MAHDSGGRRNRPAKVVERVKVVERLARPWTVPPDQPDGTLSREALIGAFVDAAVMLDIAGGCLEVVVGRAPTGIGGEMVMTGAALCWRNRSDGQPEFEAPTGALPVTDSAPSTTDQAKARSMAEMDAIDAKGEADARALAGDAPLPGHIDEADGFDYSTLAAEDVEEPVVR